MAADLSSLFPSRESWRSAVRFTRTALADVVIVDVEGQQDDRGLFARTFCEDELTVHGLASRFIQCSLSFSPRRLTLRGLHYQVEPQPEVKLVRCTRGAI